MTPEDRRTLVGVGSLFILGAGLSVIGLGHREFWHDEFCSLLYATAPEGTAAALKAGGNPPLYFFLLNGWIRLFGTSEAAVRSLSALFSALALLPFAAWLGMLGLPRRAIVWATALFALAPLRLFYAREARGYALMLLMLCLWLWALAVATRQGGAQASRATTLASSRWWVVYTIVSTLCFYTHNLMVPAAALFVVAGWILAPDRTVRMRLLAAQGAAFALYAPWMITLAQQPYAEQSRWIAAYWRNHSLLLAIPRSLFAFGVGGGIPSYIAWPSPPDWIQFLSVVVMGLAAISAMTSPRAQERAPRSGRATIDQPTRAAGWFRPDVRVRIVLLLFLLGPLVGLWLASMLGRPVYVVGRYDLPALPAYCGLLGLGLANLQRELARSMPQRIAAGVLVAILVVLGGGTLLPRLRADLEPERHPARDRIDLLQTSARPGDLVVAIDLAASNALFLLRERRLDLAFVTFPSEILRHWGWFNVEESLRNGRAALIEEAQAVLRPYLREHPGARVWVFLHGPALSPPSSPRWRNPHQDLLETFWDACRREGLRAAYPEGSDRGAFRRAGLVLLETTSTTSESSQPQ